LAIRFDRGNMLNRRAFVLTGGAFLAQAGVSHGRAPASGAGGLVPPDPAIAAYEAQSGGHIGFYAQNLRSGASLAWRADERFVMCSTFKASLAAFVLWHVDHGREKLDASIPFGPAQVPDWWAPVARANLGRGAMTVREMCAAAVEQSDNTCANLLLERMGGPAALTAFWRRMGEPQTRLDDVEPELNRTPPGGLRNTTTPRAMAHVLRQIVLGPVLSGPSRALLRQWLLGCKTGANRLRAGLPAGWAIGDKTGNNGHDAAGDIALVWPRPDVPLVICAYTRGGSPDEAQLRAVFASIGRLVAGGLAAGGLAAVRG